MTDASTNGMTDPGWHAARILYAWERRDETAFRREVARTLDLLLRGRPYIVEEQAEVLETVAARLDRCPELLNQCRSRSEGRVCIALLRHLAGRS